MLTLARHCASTALARLIAFFSQLALSLNKIGCASEIKIKKFFFDFVFLSACTIFAIVL